MSYSFNLKAPNKAAAKIAVEAKVYEISDQQPVHERDRLAILTNAYTVIDLLADDDTKDVSVSCNGHLSWSTIAPAESAPIISAAVSCSAGLVQRA